MWIEDFEGTLVNLSVFQGVKIQASDQKDVYSVVAIALNDDQFILKEFSNAEENVLQEKAQDYLGKIKASLASANQLLTPDQPTEKKSNTSAIRPRAFGVNRPR